MTVIEAAIRLGEAAQRLREARGVDVASARRDFDRCIWVMLRLMARAVLTA